MSHTILSEVMKQPFAKNYSQTENSCNYASIFPKPPLHLLQNPGALLSDSAGSCLSDDSNSEDEKPASMPQKVPVDASKLLPPIGVFWDIENCQVPKKKSAVAIAQAIRDRFFAGYREAEFVVVCDVTKENNKVIQELNYAQVNLIHVSAICKNAADEKLRQSIRRFADIYSTPAAIILISSDINFASDLNDLRYRKKMHVILLHNDSISDALILCANEHYSFGEIIESAVSRKELKEPNCSYEVLISNLPKDREPSKIKNRLKHLCDNLGGRVCTISKSVYSIRFPSLEFALRSQKRMDGEDVFGNKINVSNPIPVEDWNVHSCGKKKIHSKDDLQMCYRTNRKSKDGNSIQYNEFYSHKQFGSDNNMSTTQNLEFQQQITKNTAPFFPNNTNNFTFTKVPNIENLRIIQNPTSSFSEKSYLNNVDAQSGILNQDTLDQRKHLLENRKLNNIFTNQSDCSVIRLNNTSSSNCDSIVNSLYSDQMLLVEPRVRAQNALLQKNLAQTAPTQRLTPGQISRNNGHSDASTGRLIRGVHGANNNGSVSNRIIPQEEDCESIVSTDAFFEPIQKSSGPDNNNPVDLHVSGLDPYMDLMMTKNLLMSMFKIHVEVLSVSVFCLTDGNVVASVKVPTLQDAQYAISQLQRRQVGSRRITIAFQNSSKYQRPLLRSQVAQLLSQLPQDKTPLFRFTELFKSTFLNSISVSELNKMKDVCVISEEENGRMISANTRCQMNGVQRQEKKESIVPYCPLHAQKTVSESEPSTLPTIKIGLALLSRRIEKLLESHGGKLPLHSLSDCYQEEFEPLPEDPDGVPLEHLISCIPGIELTQSQGSFKYLTWLQAAGQFNDEHVKCVSPMLVGTMSVFTRELLELMKDIPKCLLPFSQFIPSYHRRYGRQCRVSDYGYTKLLDLLESIPHILQVLGNGSYKVVTLSHKAQVRRFTSDLVRVLKYQSNKQIDLCNFPSQYEKIMGRVWDPCDYGLCYLEDLLNCVPHSTIIIGTKKGGQTYVSIPKREQTPEEIELTKKFAQETVNLLKRVPNCSMPFNKFVPAYHNQFGRQCRVSSYGCFKLIELFESIPETVMIEEDTSRGEKYVILTPSKRLQVLAERVCEILTAEGGSMLLVRLEFAYQFYQFESVISPSDCDCENFEQLLTKIPEYVKIEDSRKGRIVILNNEMDSKVLIPRIRYILMKNEKLPVAQFIEDYAQQYGHKPDVDVLINKVPEAVKITTKDGESYVQLTQLSIFANQMYSLLHEHRGRLALPNFESAYLNKFKKACQPSQFGFPTLSSLLSAVPETVTVHNSGYYTHKRIIILNQELKNAGFEILSSNNEEQSSLTEEEMSSEEKSPRPYDLWKSDSLFPSWKDISGVLPDNITVPHPSELPLPSPKLFTPILQTDKKLLNEVEATSTTDDNNSSDVLNSKTEGIVEHSGKRKNRIAAQFVNNLM